VTGQLAPYQRAIADPVDDDGHCEHTRSTT
jgi:hypothetical protein